MNVEMTPLEMIGLKKDLQLILHVLRRLGCVQVDNITETSYESARPFTLDRNMLRFQEDLSFLLARIEGLLSTLGGYKGAVKPQFMDDIMAEARREVDALVPQVQALTSQRENLEAELASLPRYEVTLRKLIPIIPASVREPGFMMVGILVSRTHVGVLDSLGKRILEMTNGRAEIVSSDVDLATRAMLIVFPDTFVDQIEALLGKEDVSRLRLPVELGEGPPDQMLEAINRRLIHIPEEIKAVNQKMAEMAEGWGEKLATYREILRDDVDASSVLSRLGETDLTFILVGWVPEKDFENLQRTLKKEVGDTVLVQRMPLTSELRKKAPVILRNPGPAKPFESLVKLLALPTYGHIDPTILMAFFLPIFFGMILGDVGYGALLFILSLLLRRKAQKGVMRDIATILLMGSSWAILFGFLYGELFGTLGEHIGMRALWFERASAEEVTGLLIMTLVVGAVHITLGLVLGVWEAIKSKSRSHLLERGGMLLGLVSLFLIIGVLAGALPAGFKTPAICGLIIGIVLIGASLGWLGILMGPIEFISLIGNVLSYLRIAAIGLAGVYLAKVANEMVGMLGNVIVGVIVALLFHALNLVLGAFSPSIHSLRLHYVEFFRKFYEGGGKAFEPYKSRLAG